MRVNEESFILCYSCRKGEQQVDWQPLSRIIIIIILIPSFTSGFSNSGGKTCCCCFSFFSLCFVFRIFSSHNNKKKETTETKKKERRKNNLSFACEHVPPSFRFHSFCPFYLINLMQNPEFNLSSSSSSFTFLLLSLQIYNLNDRFPSMMMMTMIIISYNMTIIIIIINNANNLQFTLFYSEQSVASRGERIFLHKQSSVNNNILPELFTSMTSQTSNISLVVTKRRNKPTNKRINIAFDQLC